MNSEQKIAVVRRYLEGLRVNDLSIIDKLISPNFISYSKYMPSDKVEIMRDQAEAVYAQEERELEYTYSMKGDWVVVHMHQVFRLIHPTMGQIPDGQWHVVDDLSYWLVEDGQITAFRY
jgi:ketosteroid isomerase-like protein